MHFSIPETEVCSGENGSTYVVSADSPFHVSSHAIIVWRSAFTSKKARFETPQVAVADVHLLLQFVCLCGTVHSVNTTHQTDEPSDATTGGTDKQMLF